LNLIREGINYGWPLVTYGTDYSRLNWPLNTSQGRHEGFARPVAAFVPSVAVANLVGITSELLPLWRGDLLISSLSGQRLFRTRIEEGRAIFSESILISHRVRDIAIGADGRIVMWTDGFEVVFVEPAARVGDVVVGQCTGCHGLNDWDASALGPTLASIVGRRVASRPEFAYSDAMKAQKGRWTRERLDAFLTDPQRAVPGTKMQFAGITDLKQRRELIDYLERLDTVR
jgi:cytochrome c2